MEQLVSVILSQNEQLNRIEHAISVFTLCEKHNHGDPLPKGDQDNINMVTELLRVALTSKAIVDERCVNFQLQIQQAEIERDLERQRLCDIISDMTSRCELKDASIQQSISRVSVLEVLLDTANRSLIVAEERCIQFTSREQAAVETQCTRRILGRVPVRRSRPRGHGTVARSNAGQSSKLELVDDLARRLRLA